MEKITKITAEDSVKQNMNANSTESIEEIKISESDHKTLKNTGFSWLTEHSRNFLGAGYIDENTKAEHRIKWSIPSQAPNLGISRAECEGKQSIWSQYPDLECFGA